MPPKKDTARKASHKPKKAAPKKKRTTPKTNDTQMWDHLRAEAKITELLQHDFINPLMLDDISLRELYHIDRLIAQRLISQTTPYIPTTRIPVALRIFAALHYFAHGKFQSNFSRLFRNRQMENVVLVANGIRKLTNLHVKFPDVAAYESIQEDFSEETSFPDCIGVLDCFQIRIKKPISLHERDRYLNKDGYYSINMQLITDFNLKILQAECSPGGAASDVNIWNCGSTNEMLCKRYKENETAERDAFILADLRYRSRPWVLVPYSRILDPEDEVFNEHHATARKCSQRAFQYLESNFRCLTRLQLPPQKAEAIIEACVVLNNILFDRDISQRTNINNEAVQYRDEEDFEVPDEDLIDCID